MVCSTAQHRFLYTVYANVSTAQHSEARIKPPLLQTKPEHHDVYLYVLLVKSDARVKTSCKPTHRSHTHIYTSFVLQVLAEQPRTFLLDFCKRLLQQRELWDGHASAGGRHVPAAYPPNPLLARARRLGRGRHG